MTASVHLLFAPAADGNEFHIEKMRLITALARLPVPQVDVVPTPEQIDSIGDFVLSIARLNDRLMRGIGVELQASAQTRVKLDAFQTPFLDAVQGFACWQIAVVAEELRVEEQFEAL